jgi:hypothetical protein
MPQAKKNRKIANKKINGIIDPSVGNYEKHPFFIKKANEMKALINKVGLPKEFYNSK